MQANHAHHVRTSATAGTGLLPPDLDAVPLCWQHHAEGHQHGWQTFERVHGIDLRQEAAFYRSASRMEMP